MSYAILIRSETSADTRAIHALTKQAFAGKSYSDGSEPGLIDALRSGNALTASLVAEREGKVIGHVALTPAYAKDGTAGWYALGPISVAPACQRQGIGGRLIAASMTHLAAMDAAGCVLIGDTNYYPRHGFVPRPDLAPPGEPAQHYMVRKLRTEAPDTSVAFHPLFALSGSEG